MKNCQIVLLSLGALFASAQAAPGQDHPCAGPCQYCVDGECVPRRVTYGYYEPNWRRWPVGPPDVCIPCETVCQGGSSSDVDVDLPGQEDEADISPRFPHLRPRVDAFGPQMQMEPELPEDPFGDDSGTDSGSEGAIDDFSINSTDNLVRPAGFIPSQAQPLKRNPLRRKLAMSSDRVTRLPAAASAVTDALDPGSQLSPARPPSLTNPPAQLEQRRAAADNPLRR